MQIANANESAQRCERCQNGWKNQEEESQEKRGIPLHGFFNKRHAVVAREHNGDGVGVHLSAIQ